VLAPYYGGNEKLAKSAISTIHPGMTGYGKPVDQITAGDFRNGGVKSLLIITPGIPVIRMLHQDRRRYNSQAACISRAAG
jgi:hypothetical protein